MKRRLISFSLCLSLLFAFTGCGGQKESDAKSEAAQSGDTASSELTLQATDAGSVADNSTPEIQDEGAYKKVKAVSVVGGLSSAAITEDGSLYTWGYNSSCELGDGTKEKRSSPVKVMDHVKEVSFSNGRSAAITEDGSLYVWGHNTYGELGNGTLEEESSPVKIMDHVKAVSLSTLTSAAITEDGSLYTWGLNSLGQLGDGTTDDKLSPVKIMDHVTAVSVADNGAAITEDGSLYTWGSNTHGELGNGVENYDSELSPVKIMDHVKTLSFNAAVTEDGSLYTWGSNQFGQLGDGTKEERFSPVKLWITSKQFHLAEVPPPQLPTTEAYILGEKIITGSLAMARRKTS